MNYQAPVSEIDVMPDAISASRDRWETPVDPNN